MMKKIEIEIPDDYLVELQRAASKDGFSLNTQILIAIAIWIENEKAK
jgi:hypothetical protein